jgi:hypothetical protein
MLKKKYEKKIKNEHTRSIIGCFFFLRFILPGIVTPEIYRIIDSDYPISTFDRNNLISVSEKITNSCPK